MKLIFEKRETVHGSVNYYNERLSELTFIVKNDGIYTRRGNCTVEHPFVLLSKYYHDEVFRCEYNKELGTNIYIYCYDIYKPLAPAQSAFDDIVKECIKILCDSAK